MESRYGFVLISGSGLEFRREVNIFQNDELISKLKKIGTIGGICFVLVLKQFSPLKDVCQPTGRSKIMFSVFIFLNRVKYAATLPKPRCLATQSKSLLLEFQA